MKKLFSLLLAVILILPMGACSAEKGGESMANYLYNGVELPELPEMTAEQKKQYLYLFIRKVNDRYWVIALSDVNYVDGYFGWSVSHNSKFLMVAFVPGSTDWVSDSWTEREADYWSPESDSTWVVHVEWANFDVLNEDGTVYLHASNPILADSKLSVSVAQMMSYNGTELPDINGVWDKETYPYALIAKGGTESRRLYLSTVPLYTTGYGRVNATEGGSATQYIASYTLYWLKMAEQIGSFSAGELLATNVTSFEWANYVVLNKDGSVHLAASEQPVVVETAVQAVFACSDLLSTDNVYQVKAWCYPKGMDYWTAPATWESYLFAGPIQTMTATFTGLLPGTEYEVYACIYANGEATEHNAHTTFTTDASEEETPQAVVQYNDLTATSFTAWLFVQGLTSGTEYTAEFALYRRDASGVVYKDVTFTGEDGFKAYSCEFTDLLPNTTYVVAVDLYPTDSGEVVAHREREVTTLEGVPVVVRDSFPLGFASGLCGVPITESNADYNTWAQGHIVGAAMRKAL